MIIEVIIPIMEMIAIIKKKYTKIFSLNFILS